MPRLGFPSWDNVWLYLAGHGSSFPGTFFSCNVCIETNLFKLNRALRRTGSIWLSQIDVDGWVWWCCPCVSSQRNSWTVLFVWLFITPPYTFQNSCADSQIHYGPLLQFCYCAVQVLTIRSLFATLILITYGVFVLFFFSVRCRFYTGVLKHSLTLLSLVMLN